MVSLHAPLADPEMANEDTFDKTGYLSPKDIQKWALQEITDSAKAHELRVKDATELATAYALGELSPEHKRTSVSRGMTTDGAKLSQEHPPSRARRTSRYFKQSTRYGKNLRLRINSGRNFKNGSETKASAAVPPHDSHCYCASEGEGKFIRSMSA